MKYELGCDVLAGIFRIKSDTSYRNYQSARFQPIPQIALEIQRSAQWLVLSRPPASLPVARPHESSWLPRLPGRAPQPPAESRSPTATGPAQWLSVRSVATRSPLSSSSGSFPSNGWCARLLRTSRLTCVSRARLLPLFRRRQRPTSLAFSRTPTCAPSTPRE